MNGVLHSNNIIAKFNSQSSWDVESVRYIFTYRSTIASWRNWNWLVLILKQPRVWIQFKNRNSQITPIWRWLNILFTQKRNVFFIWVCRHVCTMVYHDYGTFPGSNWKTYTVSSILTQLKKCCLHAFKR